MVTVNYVLGYAVNPSYYERCKLSHSSQWKAFGEENEFYEIGKDQWVQVLNKRSFVQNVDTYFSFE
ncbi:hypothetical protein XA3_13070 [Xylocopilactobacillus apicola]|uniref:Uncharacterized protein n=1 Tax=Xylocopilactobacillus apicola TaxID=2932184 RepID=A0AAU9D273_9LACO|nr:hypothetical protein XA3_13070 [Xylocopilactobacillus apicola]